MLSTRGHVVGQLLAGLSLVGGLALATACSDEGDGTPPPPAGSLEKRAYIVSLNSPELTVIDLDKMEIIGRLNTGGVTNHMAELNRDFTKIFIDSSSTDQSIVVDATTLQVTNKITTGVHPTHISLSRDGAFFAIMDEGDNAVSFVDPVTETEIKRLPGFYTPHFMRFSPDGKYGYVANLDAHHITRVDLATKEIESHIVLDGFTGPPNVVRAPDEGGFGDVQIASDGVLYAAHAATGRVLVYDTVDQVKLPELAVGPHPWIAYAEHPFSNVPLRFVVPNFGDATLSLVDGDAQTVMTGMPGDEEAYGVNYTSAAPDRAFVMNRVRQDVAVVDTAQGAIVKRIPVGGNVETASTTADGKYIVAAVSSANKVVVIDAVTMEVVKTFDNVGSYPWSVTIPNGQNYCH